MALQVYWPFINKKIDQEYMFFYIKMLTKVTKSQMIPSQAPCPHIRVRLATEMFEAMCVCWFKYHWVKTACPESILTLQLSLPQNTTGSEGLDHEERGQAEGGRLNE